MVNVAPVRFSKAGKVEYFEVSDASGDVKSGDKVIVEVDRGLGFGSVVSDPADRERRDLPKVLKKVIRKASSEDIERQSFNEERESEAARECTKMVERLKLPMKVVRVEYLFDSSKAIFFFTSDIRVDFRELVKELAKRFHTRIEMRQIGVRDEAKMVGGIGPCGMELCCSTFLGDFAPVTVKMAKEQNLALNPQKISGMCGRLMCCLSFEHGMYKRGEMKGGGGCCKTNSAGGQGACCGGGTVPERGGRKDKGKGRGRRDKRYEKGSDKNRDDGKRADSKADSKSNSKANTGAGKGGQVHKGKGGDAASDEVRSSAGGGRLEARDGEAKATPAGEKGGQERPEGGRPRRRSRGRGRGRRRRGGEPKDRSPSALKTHEGGKTPGGEKAHGNSTGTTGGSRDKDKGQEG